MQNIQNFGQKVYNKVFEILGHIYMCTLNILTDMSEGNM